MDYGSDMEIQSQIQGNEFGEAADITDEIPLCQQCLEVLSSFDLTFCSTKCSDQWQAERDEELEELAHEESARYDDQNAGCWSQSW